MTYCSPNRPFPSSPGPLFQNEGRCSAFDIEVIRDGPLENWWGGGGWEIFSLHEFFFLLTACAGIFFLVDPSARIFFQTNIAFFWTVKPWFIIYVFVRYKLFYSHWHYKEWWDTFCTSLKCPSGVCAHPNTVGLNGWPSMNTKGHMHTVHYQKHARNWHNIIKNYFIHVID